MFISFEGPDGAGKTTQIELLAERLRACGQAVVTTREPGGTVVGAQLRALLLDGDHKLTPVSEAMLMSADRAEHVQQVIAPALCANQIVLTDRYLDSTLAYQGGGRGIDIAILRAMQHLATAGVMPDRTFLLDVPVAEGIARKLAGQEQNRLDLESLAFHRRVADMFRQLAAEEPDRWRVIDATQDVKMVHTAIWMHVSALLEERRSALMKGDAG